MCCHHSAPWAAGLVWFVPAACLGLECCDSFPSAASFVLCARRRRGPRCSCLSHLLFTRILWLFFSLPFRWRLPSGLTGAAFTSVWAPPGILVCIVPVRSCVCNCVNVLSLLVCPPRAYCSRGRGLCEAFFFLFFCSSFFLCVPVTV